MRLRHARVLLVLAVATLLQTAVTAAAQDLVMRDDFSSSEIDGTRWRSYAYTVRFADLGGGWNNRPENPALRHPKFSTVNVTSFRRIVGGRLHMQLESAGGMHPNPDVAPGSGRNGLFGWNYEGAVQVRVTPMVADAPACRTTGESRVRAQLVVHLGNVYWEEARVVVTLSLERSSFGGDRIHAAVSRCRNGVCVDVDSALFDRAWTLNRSHTLAIRHEPGNSRVLLRVTDGGAAAETRVLSDPSLAETGDEWSRFGLGLETTPANCPATATAPGERVGVLIDARFDDVRVGAP